MCYGYNQSFSSRNSLRRRSYDREEEEEDSVVDDLRDRLAETEARLRRARAREAELSRRLEHMKRFVSVMEIIETFLERRYQEQKDRLVRLFSPVSTK
ncbi:PREDICTED: protein SKIP34-like [Camelina sativa]|uniref:Protein SKIP34-like n=1 Tax=Camelina sativa TaxID=90675 RepID=A0ABM1R5K8_CAMSA|nr:PREDICTED: protein SKIP34-like [Camelina sativa]